ncbi:MAG TPA: FIST N-terminal domain-containing protein [Longilinea sp.]|nr:FIST N-terminal domain-containing protein [Longilinea sp.]
MTVNVAVGIGKGLDGREAARQATRQALDKLGTTHPILGLVFVSQEYNTGDAVAGVGSMLANTPLWGFCTHSTFSDAGEQNRTVAVAIISGRDSGVQVNWWPKYSNETLNAAFALIQLLNNPQQKPQALLLAVDGVSGEAGLLCAALGQTTAPVAGGLASGEYQLGQTPIIGGAQWGGAAFASLILYDRLRLGVGAAHGWRDTGIHFTLTEVAGRWIQTLNGLPAVETYSRAFKSSVQDWCKPPLNELVRLYPLGIETENSNGELTLHAPLIAETDGRLKMNATLEENLTGHLMIGDATSCMSAIHRAAQDAMESLKSQGNARPLLALVFADLAWRYLFEAKPNQVADALRMELGNIPFIGACTLGQFARFGPGSRPHLVDQHLEIALIGETNK